MRQPGRALEDLKSAHLALRTSSSSLDLQQASLQERVDYMESFDYGKLVREVKDQEARNMIFARIMASYLTDYGTFPGKCAVVLGERKG